MAFSCPIKAKEYKQKYRLENKEKLAAKQRERYLNNLDKYRLDNSKGYTSENVVPCCKECNMLRGNRLTPEETKVVTNALKQFRSKQNGTYSN